MQLNTALSKVFACPDVTFMLIGAPGSGKTSAPIHHAHQMGKHVIRVNAQNMPAEDLARLPVLSDDKQTMQFAFPELFKPRANTMILLDELLKANEEVINAFLPLIHGKELFDVKWPDDLIVVITANSAEFKVGDRLQPHVLNRVVPLYIEDHSSDSALALMLDRGYDARITGWVEKTPSALVSYDPDLAQKPDTEVEFYFGYSPKHPRRPFCSVRSLETASKLLKAGITDSESLAGAIGAKAAKHLAAFCTDASVWIDPKSILDGTAEAPANMFDQRQAAITAVALMDKGTWQPCLDFIKKLSPEVQLVAHRFFSVKPSAQKLITERALNRWIVEVGRV